MADSHNWHEDVFFGIHYDLHANANDTMLGRDITYEHIKERLLRVKPDWIQWDCKGHPGYTSWPTQVGSTSPGVVKDMLRIVRDVTKELGIKLGMHYSGVYDTRAIELHPDWARIDENGKPDPHYTCRLSAYVDELMIPQMIEVIDKYDIDGFWVDGENWASLPCWCDRCQEGFTRRTGIIAIPHSKEDAHWDDWLAFQRQVFVEYVTKYANAVHKRKSDCLICSNWMYTIRQPDPIEAPIDYISGDYSWIWGADRAAIEARFIDSRNITWDLMCWSFGKSGDKIEDEHYPWTMKTAIHLKQEVSEVIALGGAIMLYNVPQRTGWLTDWHQDLLGEIAEFSRQRKEVCFKTTSASQSAILHVSSHYYANNDPLFNLGKSTNPVEGALHCLLQNHISTDIITDSDKSIADKLAKYKLLVIPEQTRLSASLITTLTKFAEQGGHILITGAHLAKDYPEFISAKPGDKAKPIKSDLNGIYLPIDGKAAAVAGEWTTLLPDENAEILTCYLSDQEQSHNATNNPVTIRRKIGKGTITAISGPIFESYYHGHYPLIRQYIKNIIDSMNISWQVSLINTPSQLEVILRKKDNKLLINLLNRGAGIMTNERQPIIEDLPPITNFQLRINLENPPASVKYLPENIIPDYSYENRTLTINIPELAIHSIIELA